jgi:hypothetical protein
MIKRSLLRHLAIKAVYSNSVVKACGRVLIARSENGTAAPLGNLEIIGVLAAGTHARDALSQDFRIVYLHGIR